MLSPTVLGMPASKLGLATRAFVAVLLSLARRYELLLQVNRDSPEEQLVKSYKKLLLKTHPDKGGRKEDLQKLQAAKEEWEKARQASTGKAGRPSAQGDGAREWCPENFSHESIQSRLGHTSLGTLLFDSLRAFPRRSDGVS